MTVLDTAIDPGTPAYLEGRGATLERLADFEAALEQARAGGGEKAVTRHHARGKLLPRERVEMLLDQDAPFLELAPAAALGTEYPVGAGLVTGIGVVEGVECVLVATDPTVAGGADNPYASRKLCRAVRIAGVNRLPLVELVESAAEAPAGAPGGELARELSRLSGKRVPTVCVIFGATSGDAAYLPTLADFTITVRGQDKADQFAEDERDALRLARQFLRRLNWRKAGPGPRALPPRPPRYPAEDLLTLAAAPFDAREVIARLLDGSDFDEFRPLAPGSPLVAGWGELHGYPVAVLAEGGPLGPAETQKAAHFVRLANAAATCIVTLRAAEAARALADATVPHLVVLTGDARLGNSEKPRFVFSWPAGSAKDEIDGVLDPRDTRTVLGLCLSATHSAAISATRKG